MPQQILAQIAQYSAVLLIAGGLALVLPKVTAGIADKKFMNISVSQVVGTLSVAAGVGLLWK